MLRLFVGNIPHTCTETGLRQWFEEQGHDVAGAQVIRDRITGHSRGFGFVELEDTTDLDFTVQRLTGRSMGGRALTVGAANPRLPRGGSLPAHSGLVE